MSDAVAKRASFATLLRLERRRAALRSTAFLALLALAVVFATTAVRFDPGRIADGAHRLGEFLTLLVPPLRSETLLADFADWYWNFGHWIRLLAETLLMALLATALGTAGGMLLSFQSARNLATGAVSAWIAGRLLEFARAVPDLVFAIIFVFAFGLGPLPGVLAIAVHTIGAQGKLFAEANENVDMAPLLGIRAAGGSRWGEIIWGVVPQVLPNWISYTFWRLELNVRSAAIIGFVGAGGIGVELYDALRLNYYDDVGAILILVALAVFVIDDVSERLRLRIARGAAT